MSAPDRRIGRLWRHLGTASAIYGLLVYTSLIAATSLHRDEDDTVVTLLVFSAVTLVVFWAAHLFASTLAYHGGERSEGVTLWMSITHGVEESIGMIEAAVIPTMPLLLGAFGVLAPRTAIIWALITATVMLGLLGFFAFARRHSRWWIRILGAIGTAMFGIAIILLEGALH